MFFHSAESLVAGDSDGYFDVYERTGGATTTKISIGNATQHADFGGASQDGLTVVYETAEALDGADTDTALDVYKRVGATTTLLSDGPGADPNLDATPIAISDDGTRVFFDTEQAITPATDTDTRFDLYERLGSTTTHISTGPGRGQRPPRRLP